MNRQIRSQVCLGIAVIFCTAASAAIAQAPPFNTQQLFNEAQQKLQPIGTPTWTNDLRVPLSPYEGARSVFIEHYDNFAKALMAGDSAQAHAALDALQAVTELNDYEQAYIHLARYQLAEQRRASPAEQLRPLQAMFDTINGAATLVPLPQQLTTMARRALFKLQMQSNHLREAMYTYEQMQANGDSEAVSAFSDAMAQVKALADNEQHYAISALLDDTGEWQLALHKRQFFIDAVQGIVSSVDAACEKKQQSLQVEALIGYTVPASWGQCTLTFRGQPDTSFVVTQFRE